MERFVQALCVALASGLDPYSTYLTPEQVRDFNENAKTIRWERS